MKPLNIAIAACTALLFGCVSHDGTYLPGCIAYAGSKISLSDGEFAWEKFTDEVVVNDDGEVVNQFPGYPLHGTYRVDGQTVLMQSSEGETMENMYLHRADGHSYLYTAQQFEQWKSDGKVADCALMLHKNGDSG